jgi:orotidine-5'-phosphate decarboxylase
MKHYSLVLGIDSPDRRETLPLWGRVGDMVDAVKIGVPPLLANGVGLVRELKRVCDRPVVADLKVADPGFKNPDGSWAGTDRKIVETAIAGGVDWVICHSIVGTSSIRECVDTAHATGGRVLTLPFMSHWGADVFFDEPLDVAAAASLLERNGESRVASRLEALKKRKAKEEGWRKREVTVSDMILVLGEECGVDGYIGPANLPEVLVDFRKVTRKAVFATGVGRQGGSIAEVYKILGPNSAAIVATSIYAARDPVAACRAFVARRDAARHPS